MRSLEHSSPRVVQFIVQICGIYHESGLDMLTSVLHVHCDLEAWSLGSIFYLDDYSHNSLTGEIPRFWNE